MRADEVREQGLGGRRSPAVAIMRHTLRLMRSDVMTLVTVAVMPIILMAFFLPVGRQSLRLAGYKDATGAEQVVPGMTVGFGIFLVGYIAFTFMNEYGWGTWERLRASPARAVDIVVGKLVPGVALATTYVVVLFVVGGLAFDLHLRGHLLALVLVGATFPLCLVSMGILVAAVCTTNEQVNAAATIGGLFLAALGGAYVPLSLLPSAARSVAPVTPTYWAVKGFRAGILSGIGLSTAVTSAIALLGFSVAFSTLAALRFRFGEVKAGGAN